MDSLVVSGLAAFRGRGREVALHSAAADRQLSALYNRFASSGLTPNLPLIHLAWPGDRNGLLEIFQPFTKQVSNNDFQ